MINSPEVRKRRVRKLLDRSGGGTSSTNDPDRIPGTLAADVLRDAELDPLEQGLLVSIGDEGWCLLTTERLVWLQDGRRRSLSWLEVRGVQQPPQAAARIIRGDLPKDAVEDLEIFDAQDCKHVVRPEIGAGYYLIWSAIVALGNLTRQPDPIPLEP